ncbi:MAG: threonine/serine dehydratase [Clostridia bacterium]|nr:threonine/serine dehydratase [Clostridia bacterium]
MALTLHEIEAARERIAPYVIRTPLIRLENLDHRLGCQVYVKAECMQTTGSFKLRGAMNKLLSLDAGDLQRGIVAASSGNHGKAIAYACQKLGIKATIVLPETAAKVKVDTIRQWGAETVLCDVTKRFEVAEELCRQKGATLVPPFNDEMVMAGQGTAGLELMAQEPEMDAVVVPVSGGGLISGVATAIKALSPRTRVYGAEPAALPRYTASLQAGKPVLVLKQPTIADALVSQIPGNLCYPYVASRVDGIADVAETSILAGMKLLLLDGKILCEPSSGIGLGAVLQGLLPFRPEEKVCFLISGGSVALEQIQNLEA